MQIQTHADIVIVGAGSAGCVLAERLSANPAVKVVLIEAGKGSRRPLHSFALLAGHFFKRPEDNWCYYTVPQPELNNREIFWPRGKRIGGSSIFNGMVYARGNKADYDHWAELGNRGWSYQDVLPYFRRNECHEDGPSDLHGGDGMLSVTRARVGNPLIHAFLHAGEEAGFARVSDFNGHRQHGVGLYDFNMQNGRRDNSAGVLLKNARNRPNLQIVDRAAVTRVLFEGRKAVGVEFRHAGILKMITADREIILSAGAIGTPQILMLSGVGDAIQLQRHDIHPVLDLPGVGKNLIDHVDAFIRYRASKPVSLLRELRADRIALSVARACLLGSGPVTQSPISAGGYFFSREGLQHPDLQAFFMPLSETGAAIWWPFSPGAARVREAHGYAFRIGPVRPRSRGVITLASPDPHDPPLIDPRYFDDPSDLDATIAGLRIGRKILNQPAFQPYNGGEIGPASGTDSNADLARYVRNTAGTVYHPVGTAMMGHGEMAVVDDRLCVHGTTGLRIADASIMPTIPSGNTNAPTMMIAEKAADMIATSLKRR